MSRSSLTPSNYSHINVAKYKWWKWLWYHLKLWQNRCVYKSNMWFSWYHICNVSYMKKHIWSLCKQYFNDVLTLFETIIGPPAGERQTPEIFKQIKKFYGTEMVYLSTDIYQNASNKAHNLSLYLEIGQGVTIKAWITTLSQCHKGFISLHAV